MIVNPVIAPEALVNTALDVASILPPPPGTPPSIPPKVGKKRGREGSASKLLKFLEESDKRAAASSERMIAALTSDAGSSEKLTKLENQMEKLTNNIGDILVALQSLQK